MTIQNYPPETAPPDGAQVEIAPGLIWLRLPLPYRLNHVNVYLIVDNAGWAVFDTGLGDQRTEAVWQSVFETLPGPVTRVIVSHFHPDHAGMAGWIAERFNVPVYMPQTEYMISRSLHIEPGLLEHGLFLDEWRNHGMSAEEAWQMATRGHAYLKIARPLPLTFRRLCAGDTLKIGKRDFQMLTGAGHSPEQLMMYCPAEKLFFAADQVLNRISPNIGVPAVDPEDDVLGRYLDSLHGVAGRISEDVLVLPGHELPFHGLQRRIGELRVHHEDRCALIVEASRTEARSAIELVPLVFDGSLGPHEMSFAFAEVLAHINYLVRRRRLHLIKGADGTVKVIAG